MSAPTSSQMANFSNWRVGGTEGLASALDILTKQAKEELGTTGQIVFFLGDGAQRVATNWLFDLFNPGTWTPENIARIATIAGRQAIRTSELFLSPRVAQLAWQELRNKVEILVVVEYTDSVLGISSNTFVPLPVRVEKSYSLPPFQALWAVEGTGDNYTESYWKTYGPPQGLLLEKNAPVPEKSLLMLHAGMGKFFTEYLLGAGTPTLVSESPPSQFRAVVQRFVELARNNSRPGYLGAAIESLGLVVREFSPGMVQSIHEQLLEVAPDLIGYFWHGVGRALYFSRRYLLPVLSTVWAGIDREVRSCPNRLDAMAGLAWAVVLLNMRQPEIVEEALRTFVRSSPLQEGFANGVASSIIMRHDTTPEAPGLISHFCEYRPHDPQLAALWDRLIGQPCRAALDDYYPVLKQHNALGEVFRFQDLAALVARLKQAPQPGQEVWASGMDERMQTATVQ
jgi:hypothetical protein